MVVGDRSLLVAGIETTQKSLRTQKNLLAHSTDRVHFKWIQVRINEVKSLLWQVAEQETEPRSL